MNVYGIEDQVCISLGCHLTPDLITRAVNLLVTVKGKKDPVLKAAEAHSDPDYPCPLASCPFLGRKLLTVVQMPGLDQEEVPPAALVISSTGRSKDYKSFIFGQCEICQYENIGRPV